MSESFYDSLRTGGGAVVAAGLSADASVECQVAPGPDGSAVRTVTITNRGSREIWHWVLEFDLSGTVISVGGAQLEPRVGDRVGFRHPADAPTIAARGGRASFRFECAGLAAGTRPSGYRLNGVPVAARWQDVGERLGPLRAEIERVFGARRCPVVAPAPQTHTGRRTALAAFDRLLTYGYTPPARAVVTELQDMEQLARTVEECVTRHVPGARVERVAAKRPDGPGDGSGGVVVPVEVSVRTTADRVTLALDLDRLSRDVNLKR